MHCVQIDSVNARTTPSRWTLLNSYRFPSAHRDAQVTVQRVLARTLAGGITPPQVVSLRLPRYLICRPYARHHVVRPSLIRFPLLNVLERAHVLVTRECHPESIDRKLIESIPALAVHSVRERRSVAISLDNASCGRGSHRR